MRKTVIIVFSILIIVILGGFLAGIRPYILISDSMSPNRPAGSLALLDSRVRPEDLKTDDVIGIRVEGSLVFHRMGEIPEEKNNSSEYTVFLYGDSAGKENGTEVTVNAGNLLGREIITIPVLGSVAGVLAGRSALIWLFALLLLIGSFLPWRRLAARAKCIFKSHKET